MRTFSATIPRSKRSRIRENSSSIPRSCKSATSRVFKKSGRPMRLNQTMEQTAASTISSTLMRHQRKPMRHLRQKPGERISRNVRRNGEITQDELVKHRRKNKRPALAVERHGGQRGVRIRKFRAESHGKFFTAFEFDGDLQIVRRSDRIFPARSRCAQPSRRRSVRRGDARFLRWRAD